MLKSKLVYALGALFANTKIIRRNNRTESIITVKKAISKTVFEFLLTLESIPKDMGSRTKPNKFIKTDHIIKHEQRYVQYTIYGDEFYEELSRYGLCINENEREIPYIDFDFNKFFLRGYIDNSISYGSVLSEESIENIDIISIHGKEPIFTIVKKMLTELTNVEITTERQNKNSKVMIINGLSSCLIFMTTFYDYVYSPHYLSLPNPHNQLFFDLWSKHQSIMNKGRKKWTKKEINQLYEEYVIKQMDIREIALAHERTEGTVKGKANQFMTRSGWKTGK